jgi:hypothetical protein
MWIAHENSIPRMETPPIRTVPSENISVLLVESHYASGGTIPLFLYQSKLRRRFIFRSHKRFKSLPISAAKGRPSPIAAQAACATAAIVWRT